MDDGQHTVAHKAAVLLYNSVRPWVHSLLHLRCWVP